MVYQSNDVREDAEKSYRKAFEKAYKNPPDICKNILCVQNHNVVMKLNECFIRNKSISKDDFMLLQLLIWKEVKKKLKVKIK